jgi:hypothetical protein
MTTKLIVPAVHPTDRTDGYLWAIFSGLKVEREQLKCKLDACQHIAELAITDMLFEFRKNGKYFHLLPVGAVVDIVLEQNREDMYRHTINIDDIEVSVIFKLFSVINGKKGKEHESYSEEIIASFYRAFIEAFSKHRLLDETGRFRVIRELCNPDDLKLYTHTFIITPLIRQDKTLMRIAPDGRLALWSNCEPVDAHKMSKSTIGNGFKQLVKAFKLLLPVLFEPLFWSPQTHKLFDDNCKKVVLTLLCLNKKQDTLFCLLPKEVLYMVIQALLKLDFILEREIAQILSNGENWDNRSFFERFAKCAEILEQRSYYRRQTINTNPPRLRSAFCNPNYLEMVVEQTLGIDPRAGEVYDNDAE